MVPLDNRTFNNLIYTNLDYFNFFSSKTFKCNLRKIKLKNSLT